MSDIVLTPIDTINAFDTLTAYARSRFNILLGRYGSTATRQVITKTLNALGSVTDMSSAYTTIPIMFFDRYNSNRYEQPGLSNATESSSSGKSNVRAYTDSQSVVNQGDFLLVGYDSEDDSYDEKYRIIEKEAHEVAGAVVFYTLYLVREVQ